jgi:fatty acid desaturase
MGWDLNSLLRLCLKRELRLKELPKVDWNRWKNMNRREIGVVLSDLFADTEHRVRDLRAKFNPTLAVQIVFSLFWLFLVVAAFALYRFHPVFLAPIFILQSLVVFVMFTPLHETTHSIGHRKRWKNELMLMFCWPIFLGNPKMFRRLHIAHHARTNHGQMDPDHFTASPHLWLRVLKSFGLILYYHVYAFRHFRTLRWRAHITASIALPLLLLYLAIVSPFTWSILLGWVLPAFVGIGLLAYANTAWPHHPAEETSKFKNTKNSYVPWALQVLMLNQNLHLVHHLKPNLPWYQYPEYWREHQEEILKEGAGIEVLSSRPEPYSLFPERWHQAYKSLRNAIELTLKGH